MAGASGSGQKKFASHERNGVPLTMTGSGIGVMTEAIMSRSGAQEVAMCKVRALTVVSEVYLTSGSVMGLPMRFTEASGGVTVSVTGSRATASGVQALSCLHSVPYTNSECTGVRSRVRSGVSAGQHNEQPG